MQVNLLAEHKMASLSRRFKISAATCPWCEIESIAKPTLAEVKAIGPTQNKAKDAVEKVKTGAVYIGKAKFWAAVCLAFLFGVAVGSFICTYSTRSSLGRAAASVGVSPSSAGRP